MKVRSSADETDAVVATLLETSAGGRAVTHAGIALQAAWAHSAMRSILGPAPPKRLREGGPSRDRGARARITFASVTTVTAAVVALALAPLGSMPRPYAWVVPSVAAAIALLCLALRPKP